MTYRALYARLFMSMSMEEARMTLGFPPKYVPSTDEINKAYRKKSIENHPDRGGSHEMMVQVNVAKEILEGKRVNDRTPYQPTPADAEKELRAQKEREYQRALKTITAEADKCVAAFQDVHAEIDITRGRLDLREFLTDDLVDAVGKIQDEAESGLSSDLHPSQERALTKVNLVCKELLSKSARIAKMFLTVVRAQGEIATVILGMEKMKLADVSRLYGSIYTFITAFSSLTNESRALMSTINTSEEVPLTWDDLYHKQHGILIAFQQDFTRFRDDALKRLRKQIDLSRNTVVDALLNSGTDWKPPSADEWTLESFKDAAQALTKSHEKGTKNAALAARVAARFGQG